MVVLLCVLESIIVPPRAVLGLDQPSHSTHATLARATFGAQIIGFSRLSGRLVFLPGRICADNKLTDWLVLVAPPPTLTAGAPFFFRCTMFFSTLA